MARILEVRKESLPDLRLIGKRYSDRDRDAQGSFSQLWGQWFAQGWFEQLERLGPLPENGDAYMGAMRAEKDGFSYWIGMFFPPETAAPEGFEAVNIAGGELAVAYIKGPDDGELYNQHEAIAAIIAQHGWTPDYSRFCFERYACPRFTTPDEHGEVILDYGIYLKD